MLEIAGVHSFYGNIEALRGVTLDVEEGEIVTLIGANGAGKSTLLMTICGSPRARAGKITFDGEDISSLTTHAIIRLGIGHAPEGRRFDGIAELVVTARENARRHCMTQRSSPRLP